MNAQTKVEAAGPHVFQAIAEVQGELAKVGIAKNRRNTQGSGYNFRGIDDVYAALSPLLAAHKLVIVPRVVSREVVERSSKNGGALFYVTVHAEFDFVSAIDGTIHTAATFGEAMDSGDKATNKAMSAAYKYAAFMTFAIPTEGDNDADGTTHEVAARGQSNGGAVSPSRPLHDSEWAKIVQLCQATKTQGGEVKKHIGADNLKLLTDEQYASAVEYLETKLADMAKAETNAKAKEPANA